MAKGEGVSHAPEMKSGFDGEKQRHSMGKGEGPMKGGDFGIGELPGSRRIKGKQDDGQVLSDKERGCAPAVGGGAGHMRATAQPDHGPHYS